MAKKKPFGIAVFLFSVAYTFAQDFYGFVKKADSLSSPIFQAKIEITESDKPFNTLKTYFDGSFKFTPSKSQTYQVKISFNGYVDTTYSFTTDKKGNLSAQNVTVRLKKDGMRLIGMVRSKEENFPIKDVTVVLKNVMTREEKRITTGIDGAYNFKLEYETNYRMTLDKRSSGIFNKYADTTFYISTVGFNLPLDYKLDIYLETIENGTTTVREGYDPGKQPENKNLKPALNIPQKSYSDFPPSQNTTIEEDKQPFKEQDSKLKGAQDSILKLKQELERTQKQLEEVKRKKEEKANKGGGASVGDNDSNGEKNKKSTSSMEVEVISDASKKGTNKKEQKLNPPDELETTRLKALEKRKKEAGTIDTVSLKLRDTLKTNLIIAIKSAEIKAQIKDSTSATTKITPAENQGMKQETAETNIIPTDSIKRTFQLVEKNDSVASAKSNQTKNAEQKVEKPYHPKSQEELIAAAEAFARQKKMIQDSIARKNTLEKQLKEEKTKIQDKK